jgi:hypothetical protein
MGRLMRKVKPKRILRPFPKAKVKRKVRRSPYSVALEKATAKYAKAVLDYEKCLLKKVELEQALPRLERMKLALEEYLRGGGTGPRPDFSGATDIVAPLTSEAVQARTIMNQPLPPRQAAGPVPTGFQVPAHLAHMIKEHPLLSKGGKVQGGVTHVQLSSNDPDDQLPDLGPGNELIPDHQVIIDE